MVLLTINLKININKRIKTKLISTVKETQGRDWNYDESTYEVLAITGCT